MSFTLTQNVTLETEECGECHILFALPVDLLNKAKKDENVYFYCPNGHHLHFANSENLRLRRRLEIAEADTERAREQTERAREQTERAREQRDDALKEVTNQKRQRTRLLNRVKAGVCPECHRTIHQMADHVASCHMGKEEAEKIAESHIQK